MKKNEAILDVINRTWQTEDYVNAWNHVCDERDTPEDGVRFMKNLKKDLDFQINEWEGGLEDLINQVKHGDFRTQDEYWWYDTTPDGECIMMSGNRPEFDGPVDMDAIVDFIVRNGDELTEGVDKVALFYIYLHEYFPGNEMAKDLLAALIDDYEVDLINDDWDEVSKAVDKEVKDMTDLINRMKRTEERW
jgi:hypothetical protein